MKTECGGETCECDLLDLKTEYGKRYKVSLEESYGAEAGRSKKHFYIVEGRRGNVMAWDGHTLEVTVNGVPLKLKEGVLPDRTHNLALPIKLERNGWKVKNHYDDSVCFLVPKEQYQKAFKVIKAKNRKQMTPELAQRLARMRSLVSKPLEIEAVVR